MSLASVEEHTWETPRVGVPPPHHPTVVQGIIAQMYRTLIEVTTNICYSDTICMQQHFKMMLQPVHQMIKLPTFERLRARKGVFL